MYWIIFLLMIRSIHLRVSITHVHHAGTNSSLYQSATCKQDDPRKIKRSPASASYETQLQNGSMMCTYIPQSYYNILAACIIDTLYPKLQNYILHQFKLLLTLSLVLSQTTSITLTKFIRKKYLYVEHLIGFIKFTMKYLDDSTFVGTL